jgi:hypothetical protein
MDRDLFLRASAGRDHRLEAAQAATSARSHAQAVELLLTENRGRESSGQFRLSRTRVSPHLVGSPVQVPEQAGPAQVPAASVSGSSCRRCTPGPGARRALLDLGLKGKGRLTHSRHGLRDLADFSCDPCRAHGTFASQETIDLMNSRSRSRRSLAASNPSPALSVGLAPYRPVFFGRRRLRITSPSA